MATHQARPARNAAGGSGALSVSAAVSAALGVCAVSHAGQLPVPCVAAACGANAGSFVSSGAATATATANQLTVNQSSSRAVLNWASFNVDAGNKVTFNQPSTAALAVNRIFQNDPSRIFGSVQANGQIYLINQNGIIFGSTAQINANSLVASSLDITPEALNNGILSPQLVKQGLPLSPAFASNRVYVTDQNGNVVTGADGLPIPVKVQVQQGAQISSDAAGGGRVMLLGQQVENAGSVTSPSGQVIMAAGQSVYLQASGDDKLRGLLVEVDTGGKVWNQITGSVSAPQGNVTLLGLAVNQEGRVSATTSVNANGSIRLLAADTADFSGDGTTLTATRTGNVELGAQSSTTVLPELASTQTAVNDQTQNPSTVEVTGRQIHLAGGSQIVVPGGNVTLTATQDPKALAIAATGNSAPAYDSLSEVRVDSGASIDVSGSNVTLPMSANLVSVQLRASELADDPLQRDGPLRGKTVVVDARVGTTLANVSGEIAAIPHNIGERTSTGGTVSIASEGDAVLAQGSTVNVSGGSVSYTGGVVATSKVVGANGRIYDIGTADPNQSYVGVINPTYTVTNSKWGVVSSVNGPSIGTYQPGYVQGKNAGTIQLQARGLIVNGTLTGNAVNGPYQRDASTRAQGGALIVGSAGNGSSLPLDLWAPAVTFVNSVPNIAVDLEHPLPSWFTTLELPTAYLDSGGFTRTAIYSNGSVTLPEDTALSLAPYSSFSLNGATVKVGSNIRAPDSALSFNAVAHGPGVALTADRPSVTVTSGVRLDVSGEWVNDSPTLVGPNPMYPTAINGGSVQLSNIADGSFVSIESDAAIDVSAGGWARASGKTSYGTAGTISINALHQGGALSIGQGVELAGYGAQGGSGGQLNISAPRLSIVHGGAPWATSQSVDFKDPTAGAFELSDALFSTGGFTNYNVTATGPKSATADGSILDPLSISADTHIEAQPLTRIFASDLISQPTTASPAALYSIQLLPQYQRAATSLSFKVSPDGGYLNPTNTGDLVVSKGAFVGLDPGSRISLSSTTNIRIDGTLSAPAGDISVTLNNPSVATDPGYQAAQGIYLGADAVLQARGVPQYVPNDLGLRQGEVLAGGNVTLAANRGSLFLQSGALLDVSGVSAPIDIVQTRGTSTAVTTETVASAGGAIVLSAAEGMDLGARLLAESGTAAGAVGPGGGSLSIALSRTSGFSESDDVLLATFPTTPRSILVVSGEGTDSNGGMVFDPGLIDRGGFSSLSLAADDSIRFGGGTALNLGQSLSLRAPNLVSSGSGAVTLTAPYIGLGPTDIHNQTPAATTAGLATLSAQAGLIELTGNMSLQGFASTTLTSANDIRALGVINGQQLTGSFNASGTLALNAREIYPTTLSQFTINVPGGTITTASTGAAQPVLEAGGALSLTADTIDHGGSIESPLGRITLQAQKQLTLESGSLVSVSGQGQTIPFGTTVTGSGWIYQLSPSVQVTIDKPPEKGVKLSAADVTVANGATVDTSGGGELYAYEFVPGTGGTKDALSVQNSGNTYAIVPGYGTYAPYDPQENNSALQPGSSIYLSGIPGVLAAGTYALLPARYALLPGAFLVTPVKNTTNLQPGSGTSLPDGTPVVSGYYAVAGTSQRDTLASGFAVRPGSYGRQLAQYNDNYASSYFKAVAANAGTAVPQLPIDSGSLALAATESLTLNGDFLTHPATGGRGSNVDLAASNVDIVSQLTPDVAAGIVQLTAQELIGLNAQSLLVGGTRSRASDGGTSIDVTAQNVTVESGVSLSGSEILLVAQDTVGVGSGAQISATGSAPPPAASNIVSLNSSTGSSALLRVSSADQIEVQRTNGNSAAGILDVRNGAAISASRSITLSATEDTRSNGTLDANGGSISLESSLISLGDGSAADHGLILSNQQLANLGSLDELQLISRSSIDFYGSVNLGTLDAGNHASLGSLLLSSPQVRGWGGSDTAVQVAAGTVRLGNGASSAGAAGTGTGTLSLEGNSIELDSGVYGFSGFNKVNLLSRTDLLAKGAATLSSAADLTLSGARLIGTDGAELTIDASGHDLQLIAPSGSAAGSASAGLGARLSLLAGTIEDAGVIQLPSGQVHLEASQSLKIGSGASIDAAGVVRTLGTSTVSTPGGSVALLADSGDVVVDSAAAINVSGGSSGGAAGTISVLAGGTADLQGTFKASSASGSSGGTFLVNAAQLTDFGSLNGALNSNGFGEQRQFEIRNGDLTLASSDTIVARQVGISVDAGALTVNGKIDAHGDHGAAVQLFARDDLMVGSTGSIVADSTGSSAVGGTVELGALQGTISTVAGSLISVAGPAGGGDVRLRAAADNSSGVRIGPLDGTIRGASSVTAEVVRTYDNVTQIDSTLISQIQADLTGFDATAAAVAAMLGKGNDATFHVAPAVEIRSAGDLTLASAWDLAAWRTGAGQAGELTLRAAGNLNLDATLSDGLAGPSSLQGGASWAYRLVGGANLLGADPNAIAPLATLAAGSGDVSIASGVSIRTGVGNIDVSAGRDLQFADQTSLLYTVGAPGAGTTPLAVRGAGTISFGSGGGDIRVTAGNDIVGAPSNQITTGWLLRQAPTFRDQTLYWGVDFSKFQEGIGALGGGNVSISAGRDIANLSAVIPTSGRAGIVSQTVTTWGGGDLSVTAGRDILGGVFYVDSGTGVISAGRSIAAGANDGNGNPFATVLALGAGSMNATSGNGLTLETILDPTLQFGVGSSLTYFSTYVPSSSAHLLALSGSLTLVNDAAAIGSVDPILGNTHQPEHASTTYPGTLSAVALGGDINVLGEMGLFPSAGGNLDLLAADNVNLKNGITESDAFGVNVPTPTNPIASPSAAGSLYTFASGALHVTDPVIDHIVADAGDISGGGSLKLAEPVDLIAGRDIRDVDLFAQNLRSTDATVLQAGRDINYADANPSTQILVAGPGSLDLFAGRDVNLGFTKGLSTVGATLNPLLPDGGADINVFAGLGRQPDYAAFIQQYFGSETTYSDALIKYVETLSGASGLTAATALDAFKALPFENELPLVLATFFDELRQSGRDANLVPGAGYKRGFAAINTLFPGSTQADGSTTPASQLPYSGDLTLYFSRIYTVAGGNINLLAPGGLIDVGLATVPESVASRPPSELGIVTQGPGDLNAFSYGDVLVNASRMFTLDGGDIAIWSSAGNIDAGRGAKTAISAPPPIVTVDQSGNVKIDLTGSVAGSGIRTIQTDKRVAPGDVDLIAPSGFVNAGDAGIGSAGNLNIAAPVVLGVDNIQAAGSQTGVPLATNSLAAGLTGVSNAASAATKSGEEAAAPGSGEIGKQSAADATLGWLDVFVTGLGEENCKPEDAECLKREKSSPSAK